MNVKAAFFGGGAGVGQTAYAGAGEDDLEWVLKRETSYVIVVTHADTSDRNFSLNGFLYLEEEAEGE